ncbi:hypothetical protein PENTCL1PPCAC_5238, partial [Pristionchus entomophagus]
IFQRTCHICSEKTCEYRVTPTIPSERAKFLEKIILSSASEKKLVEMLKKNEDRCYFCLVHIANRQLPTMRVTKSDGPGAKRNDYQMPANTTLTSIYSTVDEDPTEQDSFDEPGLSGF